MALTTRLLRDPLLTDFRMDDFFGRVLGNGTGFVPALDIRETDDEYLVLCDLPGVKSEDVAIEVEDNVLTISGSRAPVETGEIWRSERMHGSFVRRLTLPKGVDSDNIVADYRDGVLELHLPKLPEQKPKRIAIRGGRKELTE
jgi:HSP20 family protein